MGTSIGSVWRKWDLHVHTPDSIAATGYKASETGDAWENFLLDLESLPEEFKVIGINDYIFLDGYRKVIKAKKDGRLSNIDLILPVIELRIDKFGGAKNELSRVNLHVIFSDGIDVEIIQQHFLNALPSKYNLTPEYSSLHSTWNALATRESLCELGQMIIQSVPEERRSQFGSPIIEGFNNINFNLKDIEKVLESHYFSEKYYLAAGKTEWANIKWNDNTIADKKNIINTVDIVFTSAESIPSFVASKKSLTDSSVNDILLDCSDAHHFSNSKEKDRIGKCFTWIKADCTFKGLGFALLEHNERIFIGEKPEKLEIVDSNKTRYIKSIEITKKETNSVHPWFNKNSITLNPGLVSIIGNKGSGKSALADIIALLGNSKTSPYSFLTETKFKDKKNNLAKYFDAEITWQTGIKRKICLNDNINHDEVELVKYISQQFLETICNEISGGNDSEFDKELKKVIFSHVSESNRLGCDSLESLINFKTKETNKAILNQKSKLSEVNKQISYYELESTIEKLNTYKSLLSQKQNELIEHDKIKPIEVLKPNDENVGSQEVAATNNEIIAKSAELENITKAIKNYSELQKKNNITIITLQKILQKFENFRNMFNDFKTDLDNDLVSVGMKSDEIVKLEIDTDKINEMLINTKSDKLDVDRLLNPDNQYGLIAKNKILQSQLKEIQEKLDEPNKIYQNYLKEFESWNNRRSSIIGSKDEVDTLQYIMNKVNEIENVIPQKLMEERQKAFGIAGDIYDEIVKLKSEYEDLYEPVQSFTESNVIVKDKFKLKFEVAISLQGFTGRFFNLISNGNKGSFYGVREGTERLESIYNSIDFNEKDQAINFINIILENLRTDSRNDKKENLSVSSQLRKEFKLEELYDYLFSFDYLKPKYELKLGNRELNKLSPGEKGMLLLMFYLLIDKGDIPLIIDQPEENLDNESIVGLLVPCIQAAKKRRQIIMVTHNPNLAVVCDAEQVICSTIERDINTTITYTAGSIENIITNKTLVDVLEGTPKAFNNRDQKYYCIRI